MPSELYQNHRGINTISILIDIWVKVRTSWIISFSSSNFSLLNYSPFIPIAIPNPTLHPSIPYVSLERENRKFHTRSIRNCTTIKNYSVRLFFSSIDSEIFPPKIPWSYFSAYVYFKQSQKMLHTYVNWLCSIGQMFTTDILNTELVHLKMVKMVNSMLGVFI